MEIRTRGLAIPGVRLVIAAPGTERPRPAQAAIGLVRDVVRLEKRVLRVPIDAVAHGAELVRIRPCEAMAQRDVAVGRDTDEAETGAARKRLAHALVELLKRLFHVREAMVPVGH